MKKLVLLIASVWTLGMPLSAFGEELCSGEYFVKQSWSQEKNFERPYHVVVPEKMDQENLPVLIFLHGNGGNAKGAMNGFTRAHKKLASQYILVFAEGYAKSWNIVSERSKADDLGFIEEIVARLAKFDNVEQDNFTIMGASNGAALVNQIAIESRLSNVRNYICAVSPLNTFQYDGTNFKAKGEDNHYRRTVKPITGKRLMNISGTEDQLVPYRGGPSKRIPAKDGKLSFVDAEESIFLWANVMGNKEQKLTKPTSVDGNLELFSYLDGDVIHYKVLNQGHGATRAVSEERLLDFLNH